MTPGPRVSVVIPLYQAARFIKETLDSVAAQSSPAAEVLVVDDGSTDDGASIALAHALKPRVLRKTNGGPASARNAGIAMATGELVAFLDADDLWEKEKLARQVATYCATPGVGLFFAHMAYFQETDGTRQLWNTTPPRPGSI
jgi:glycosyltransferase involved in cell wall biosynthesis